jgi:membrane associated rhomboid family serine protease
MRDAAIGHQCPECVAQGRRTQRPARTALGGGAAGRGGYVTKTLIGLNLAVAAIVALVGGAGSLAGGAWGGVLGGATEAHERFAVLGYAVYVEGGPAHGVAAGEYYRLFTAMFLHYGVAHLLLNMWALWVLGRTLEADLGPVRFAILYLVSGIGGNVAAYLFSDPQSLTAGASTAVYGLFAAVFVIFRRLGRDTSAVVPIIVINLLFTVVARRSVSLEGHLGGFVTGGLVAAILAYAPRGNRTVIQVIGCGLVFVSLVLLSIARTSSLLA